MSQVNNNPAARRKSHVFMIPIFGVAFYGVISLFLEHLNILSQVEHHVPLGIIYSNAQEIRNKQTNPLSLPSSTNLTNQKNSSPEFQDRCLGLGFEEDMDKLLSKYKQVFMLMPAKSAGTSIKRFTHECMTSMEMPPVKDNHGITPAFFQSELKMPNLISYHIQKEKTFQDVVKGATDDTLILYSHRQETNRLVSAIKNVFVEHQCKGNTLPAGVSKVSEKACHVQEGVLIERIRDRIQEIGWGGTKFLTCETFKTIKDNIPNLVFFNYKQVGKLQKLIAKHHCPEYEKEWQTNIASTKSMIVSVILEGGEGKNNNGTLLPLEDWLRAKVPVLEYSLDLKRDVSCQATTRKIQSELFACADEALGISGLLHDGQAMDFPL